MARLTDDDFSALQARLDQDAARPLGALRLHRGRERNEQTETWLAAGDTLAEKAIAALDLGDAARAARLVRRIVALPLVDEERPAGLLAVQLNLFMQVLHPDDTAQAGLLDAPLRLLPGLAAPVADELLRVLAAITDHPLPTAVVRRIEAVVPLERRLEPPFDGVPADALEDAVTGVLRLVLQLRSAP